MSATRQLARFCSLEMLFAGAAQEEERVADAFLAACRLAEDQQQTPLLINQLVAFAVHGITVYGFTDACKQVSLNDTQLAALIDRLNETATPAYWEEIFAHSQIGDFVLFNSADDLHFLRSQYEDILYESTWQPWLLGEPTYGDEQQLTILLSNITFPFLYAARLFEVKKVIRFFFIQQEIAVHHAVLYDDALPAYEASRAKYDKMTLLSPRFITPCGGLFQRFLHAYWRHYMMIQSLRTALGVERFRLNEGRIPENLEAITPEYLPEIPRDIWNYGAPLSYRIREDGGFTVYSLAENQVDDGGSTEDCFMEGDLPFTLPAPEARRPYAPAAARGEMN